MESHSDKDKNIIKLLISNLDSIDVEAVYRAISKMIKMEFYHTISFINTSIFFQNHGQYKYLYSIANQLIEKNIKISRVLISALNLAVSMGHGDMAELFFNTIIIWNPMERDAYQFIMQYYLRSRNVERFLNIYNAARRKVPFSVRIYVHCLHFFSQIVPDAMILRELFMEIEKKGLLFFL